MRINNRARILGKSVLLYRLCQFYLEASAWEFGLDNVGSRKLFKIEEKTN